LADSCVSGGLMFKGSTEILAKWGDQRHARTGRQEWMYQLYGNISP